MIEPLRTWTLLRQLRSHVHASPERLRELQDARFREAILHAYQHVPFYRRYWDEAGFNPRAVSGTQDLEGVPIMTQKMARTAARQGDLLARKPDAAAASFLSTTGSSGDPLSIARSRFDERLWRAQGLRIWLEHGYRWQQRKAQFNLHPGTPHVLQRLGISRTRWISPHVPGEELRDRFLAAQADWIITTPTVLRRLAGALAADGRHFPPLRGIFCQGEILDKRTRDLGQKVLGVIPVDVYTLTEVGYVAWQCERREGLHVNADTHLVEVLRGGAAVGPGVPGRVVITDLYNRAMPFLRYDTGDLAIAGNGNCGCGRGFPCIRSFEGRQRDAIQLRDGCSITSRSVVDHMAQVLPPDAYQLHQETMDRFRLQVFAHAMLAGGAIPREPPGLPKNDVFRNHLRALLGEVEISIQITSPPRGDGEKTYPVVANSPALFT